MRKPTELTNTAASQLQEYFAGRRTSFELPLAQARSDFQQRVRDAVLAIPYGETRTAAQIAQILDSPNAHRSVGSALARNPFAVVVPTHRVTGGSSSGKKANIDAGLRALEQQRGKSNQF